MTHKKKIKYLFLATVIVFLLAILVTENSIKFGLCTSTYEFNSETKCFDEREVVFLLDFLIIFLLVSFPLLLTLYFTHPSAFKIWKKITTWFLSIVAGFWLIDTFMDYWVGGSGGGSGMMGGGAILDVGFLMYVIYFVVSLTAILRVHFREKRVERMKQNK